MIPRMHRSSRAAGALVGTAVGDALGAPFAGPPGRFSARFPTPARGSRTEMCGTDSLAPGEFTDVTRMALREAEQLLAGGSPDGPGTIAAAIRSARAGASEGAFAEMVRRALDGEDPLAGAASPEPAPARAVAALREGRDFAGVLRAAIDAGGDTSATGALAGGLAGAVFGMGGIPSRWASAVHGRVGDRTWRLPDLQQLAAALDSGVQQNYDPGVIPRIGPAEVLPGIWAGNLDGARYSDEDFAVISLCRLGEPFPHPVHRMAYIADNDHNADLDVMLADVLDDMKALQDEGHRLLVHCHGGASRTGLVLRGWLVREEGMSVEEATAHVAERWPHLGLWNESFTAALGRLRPRAR